MIHDREKCFTNAFDKFFNLAQSKLTKKPASLISTKANFQQKNLSSKKPFRLKLYSKPIEQYKENEALERKERKTHK